jgi:RNA-binding protein 25
MRPWISKKATAVFDEELAEFVDYVVACIKEHVNAPRMLELLESLLDDDAEKFVALTWRKLIFEIKKVEEGLA